MAETKTKPTDVPVEEFIAQVEDPVKRADSRALIAMMQKLTGEPPKMWGPRIVGFGRYHYKYASGHEGDSCIAGFSPRKAEFSIYLMPEVVIEREDLLKSLGKHRMGKGCLYVKRLQDVDLKILEKLVKLSADGARKAHPGKAA